MSKGAAKRETAARRRPLTPADYLILLGCAVAVVAAAMIQHNLVLGVPAEDFRIGYFVVPALVGGTFGYLLVRLRHMIAEQRRLAGELIRNEQAILEMNEDLEKTVAARTRALESKQRELIQAQKMEAVGRLAGGIAHDFNNLLTVIVGGAEFLTQELEEGTLEREMATEILDAGERSASLTSQLLLFCRKHVSQPTVFDVPSALRRLLPLLERLVGERNDLELDLCESAAVWCDRVQLEQAIMNLVINARDATADQGRVRLSVEAGSRDGEGGEWVKISVRDEGEGMSPEVVARIFDPFFTTKPAGKGTGLGLAVAYGVAESCGGSIDVVTAPGQGTTMTLIVPGTREREAKTDGVPAPACRTGDGVRILLVEDDMGVRGFVSSMLSRLGSEVVEASTVAEARILLGSEQMWTLLLADLQLPDGNGVELVRIAAERSTPVLVMTAFTADDVVAELKGVPVLPKPFTTNVLAARVSGLIAASPSQSCRIRQMG